MRAPGASGAALRSATDGAADLADKWIEGEPLPGLAVIGLCVIAAIVCPMDRFIIAVWPLAALIALTVLRMFSAMRLRWKETR